VHSHTLRFFRVPGYAIWFDKHTEYFQALMNEMFRDYVDNFILVYLEDVLIFSRSEEEQAACRDGVTAVARREAVCKTVEV
jgi:hypothetical protein